MNQQMVEESAEAVSRVDAVVRFVEVVQTGNWV